jgi:probable H4MPT-linked C1 transfer pathway protein
VYAVDGRFLTPAEARQAPFAVAAANWAATANAVAAHHPDTLLIDIGTTSTDIIPIVCGVVVAMGRTDPERLASGELVYTGALRTPAEAIASDVLLGGEVVGVSAEGFALAGDVHVWRGDLAPADYTVPTPDGRPTTREFAGERLARVICADRELLNEESVSAIADTLANAQVTRIGAAVDRVRDRHPSIRTAVVTGLGAFLGTAAAQAAGLEVVPLAAELGEAAARCAPAASVALLLDQSHGHGSGGSSALAEAPADRRSLGGGGLDPPAEPFGAVDIVVKVGGGLLSHARCLDTVLAAIGAAARDRRLLVVPGGGPFADAVREIDRTLTLSDDAAHWMAVLAMDQYAHLIAARLPGAVLLEDTREIGVAIDRGLVPVLAPSRWLRTADPLPHTWDVTSDSIAAWVAGNVGASRLVLIKPPGLRPGGMTTPSSSEPSLDASGGEFVDAYLARARPPHVTLAIVAANQVDALRSALRDKS